MADHTHSRRVDQEGLTVVSKTEWPTLKRMLKEQVTLTKDGSRYPYAEADLRLETLGTGQLRPTALYVLRDHLERVRVLNQSLESETEHSIFELSHRLTLNVDGEEVFLAPPVVEKSIYDGEKVLRIVDGLHRCYLAKYDNASPIRCIVAENVECPLLIEPVDWKEVKKRNDVPPDSEKRRYTYGSKSAFRVDYPDISLTGNHHHRFYRDLSILGSDGVRQQNGE